MPTNLYGPGDNYHPENSHVIPGLIRRIHEAKMHNSQNVVIWGSGKPRREFMYVDDMAEACLKVMSVSKEKWKKTLGEGVSHINIGTGKDISIEELAMELCDVIGFEGSLYFDRSKPDGTPRKILDISKLRSMGWRPKFSLAEGLKLSYQHYQNEYLGT